MDCIPRDVVDTCPTSVHRVCLMVALGLASGESSASSSKAMISPILPCERGKLCGWNPESGTEEKITSVSTHVGTSGEECDGAILSGSDEATQSPRYAKSLSNASSITTTTTTTPSDEYCSLRTLPRRRKTASGYNTVMKSSGLRSGRSDRPEEVEVHRNERRENSNEDVFRRPLLELPANRREWAETTTPADYHQRASRRALTTTTPSEYYQEALFQVFTPRLHDRDHDGGVFQSNQDDQCNDESNSNRPYEHDTPLSQNRSVTPRPHGQSAHCHYDDTNNVGIDNRSMRLLAASVSSATYQD